MPLNTQILRNGEALPIRWGGFHIAAMVLAATWDSGQGPFEDNAPPADFDYPNEPCGVTPGDAFRLVEYGILSTTPLNSGRYALKGEHKFLDTTDGEILHLLPGDVLVAYRN